MKRGLLAYVGLTAVMTAVYWLVRREDRGFVYLIWMCLLLAGFAFALVTVTKRVVPPERRPRRLEVVDGGFYACRLPDLSLAQGPLILSLGLYVSIMVDSAFVGLAPTALPLLGGLLLAFRPVGLTLTPAGIVVRSLLSRRTHRWGEPFLFSRDLAVNPWFLSAAIQWYAQRPDERAGIGTPQGHDRLMEALNAQAIA